MALALSWKSKNYTLQTENSNFVTTPIEVTLTNTEAHATFISTKKVIIQEGELIFVT